ncbi:MAG TPA: flagellar motor switch protein FliN [Pirellulales bacterium]|nr:flagellar motor switch protein FliN [Pirellulales bacterium]
MDDNPPVQNDEIERLLQQAQAAGDLGPAAADAATPEGSPSPFNVENLLAGQPAAMSPGPAVKAVVPPPEGIAPADVELLLQQAQEAIASIDQPQHPAAGAKPLVLEELNGAAPNTERATLDLIRDVELDLRIEFGRTNMYLEDVLKLRKGSVVPLDKLAGDPVDIFVNGRLIAKGEVLVLNDNFCVRVAELIAGEPAN